MEKLYWINGIGYINLLKKHGYVWLSGTEMGTGSGIEKFLEEGYSDVISVNYSNKTVGIVPLEIYASDSPTANAEKFRKIADLCGNLEDLENDLITESAKGEKAC